MNPLRIVLAFTLLLMLFACAREQPAAAPETAAPEITAAPAAETAVAPDETPTAESEPAETATTDMEPETPAQVAETQRLAPVRLDRKLVAKGSDLFRSKCASCHGPSGDADTQIGRNRKLPPLSSDETQNLSDEEIAEILRGGKESLSESAHKSRSLSDDQIRALIEFIRSLSRA